MQYKVGIDIGSTTIKVVVINESGELVFSCYRRHMSRIAEKLSEVLQELALLLNGKQIKVAITGSAGM